MRVFVTGATGFIGSAVVHELQANGHTVLGLVRSDASAAALAATGAEVLRGDLEDLGSLARGARDADGVIHTGFVHDFSRFVEVCAIDERAIVALADALAGSNRPLIVTSGTAILSPGTLATESIRLKRETTPFPRVSEFVAAESVAKGVKAMAVRLPPTTHGAGDHGFVPMIINLARETGVSAYVGDGANRWPAAHRTSAATVFRLALEKGTAGAHYHAIVEEGVPFRAIAETIGRHLNLPVVSKTPEEAAAHFRWLGHFVALDCPASSAWTQATLGWTPEGPDLLSDMRDAGYFD